MDPVNIKFVQLIFAEILGAILCLGGIYLFIRGIAGRSSLLLQGPGLKARLTNGAPGSVIALIGLALVAFSLNSTVERREQTLNPASVLKSWLDNSYKVTSKMKDTEVENTIIGTDSNSLFTTTNIKIENMTTLGQISGQQYIDEQFWHLLAAINKNSGYYNFDVATASTQISPGSLIQAWHVSRYYGMTVETRTRVAGANRTAAYDQLLGQATRGDPFNFSDLVEEYRPQELELAWSPANLSDVRSLRELSLKYYGSPKYWPLVTWENKDKFDKTVSENTDPNTARQPIYIAHFLGWPR